MNKCGKERGVLDDLFIHTGPERAWLGLSPQRWMLPQDDQTLGFHEMKSAVLRLPKISAVSSQVSSTVVIGLRQVVVVGTRGGDAGPDRRRREVGHGGVGGRRVGRRRRNGGVGGRRGPVERESQSSGVVCPRTRTSRSDLRPLQSDPRLGFHDRLPCALW